MFFRLVPKNSLQIRKTGFDEYYTYNSYYKQCNHILQRFYFHYFITEFILYSMKTKILGFLNCIYFILLLPMRHLFVPNTGTVEWKNNQISARNSLCVRARLHTRNVHHTTFRPIRINRSFLLISVNCIRTAS